jgi:type IV secretion system protein VirD4
MTRGTRRSLGETFGRFIAFAIEEWSYNEALKQNFLRQWKPADTYPDFAPGMIWLGRAERENGTPRPVGVHPSAHCLTIASSRAGKGVSLIIPNLLTWPGSVFCVDPKGENAQITARERLRMGQRVAVLDPLRTADIPDTCRAAFNPLDMIKPDDPAAEPFARLIAETFIESSEGERHFGPSATSLFAACILYTCDHITQPDRNLDFVREMITTSESDSGQIALLKLLAQSSRTSVRRLAGALQGTPEKERASFFSTAVTQTGFLDDHPMQQVLGPSTFQLSALKNSPRGLALYLCLPADEMSTYSKWLRLIVRLALKAMLRAGDPATGHRTLFLLDEFHLLRYVKELEDSAPLMAGAGVLLWPFVQEIQTLQRDYPKSWRVFFSNSSMRNCFGLDYDQARIISEHLGSYETLQRSFSRGESVNATLGTDDREREPGYSSGSNTSTTMKPLLTPQQIQQFFSADSECQLVFLQGDKPGELKRIHYYDDPAFPQWYPPPGKPGPRPFPELLASFEARNANGQVVETTEDVSSRSISKSDVFMGCGVLVVIASILGLLLQ